VLFLSEKGVDCWKDSILLYNIKVPYFTVVKSGTNILLYYIFSKN